MALNSAGEAAQDTSSDVFIYRDSLVLELKPLDLHGEADTGRGEGVVHAHLGLPHGLEGGPTGGLIEFWNRLYSEPYLVRV